MTISRLFFSDPQSLSREVDKADDVDDNTRLDAGFFVFSVAAARADVLVLAATTED